MTAFFVFSVHKAHKEELDSALVVLEQLLLHLPELLGRGWQQHALLRTLSKLLHPGNSWKLRKDAIRLVFPFIWNSIEIEICINFFFFFVAGILLYGIRHWARTHRKRWTQCLPLSFPVSLLRSGVSDYHPRLCLPPKARFLARSFTMQIQVL